MEEPRKAWARSQLLTVATVGMEQRTAGGWILAVHNACIERDVSNEHRLSAFGPQHAKVTHGSHHSVEAALLPRDHCSPRHSLKRASELRARSRSSGPVVQRAINTRDALRVFDCNVRFLALEAFHAKDTPAPCALQRTIRICPRSSCCVGGSPHGQRHTLDPAQDFQWRCEARPLLLRCAAAGVLLHCLLRSIHSIRIRAHARPRCCTLSLRLCLCLCRTLPTVG